MDAVVYCFRYAELRRIAVSPEAKECSSNVIRGYRRGSGRAVARIDVVVLSGMSREIVIQTKCDGKNDKRAGLV